MVGSAEGNDNVKWKNNDDEICGMGWRPTGTEHMQLRDWKEELAADACMLFKITLVSHVSPDISSNSNWLIFKWRHTDWYAEQLMKTKKYENSSEIGGHSEAMHEKPDCWPKCGTLRHGTYFGHKYRSFVSIETTEGICFLRFISGLEAFDSNL